MSLFPQPKHVGFTGTQEGMTSVQNNLVYLTLRQLFKQGYTWFHHGDCIGADATAAQLAKNIGYKIHCHPPTSDKARAFVPYDVCDAPLSYLARNKKIVEASTVVLATPKTIEEEVRSGTWSTVRYARKLKVQLNLIYPS